MKETIRKYLSENGASDSSVEFGDNESLLEAGVIDSMSMIELIEFLEGEFSISIGEDDMTPEHFDSVSSIVEFVTSKQG